MKFASRGHVRYHHSGCSEGSRRWGLITIQGSSGTSRMFLPPEVMCSGDACVISGSESAMRDYVIESGPDREAMHTIRKTRFAEIMFGIRSGAAYAFDEGAYSRFYPLALEAGLHVAEADFESAKSRGDRFLIVRVLEL